MRSNNHPLAGLCYVLSEAFYHLHPQFKLRPMVARHRGQTHWWLESNDKVIDLTSEQFDRPFPYHLGHGCGFLTKQPSRRAKAIMEVLERKS